MIRPYRESDRDRLMEITEDAFAGVSIDYSIEQMFGTIAGTTWQQRKRRHIEADIAMSPDGIFIAEAEGEVVGYVTTKMNRMSRVGSIANLAVDPAYQGRGKGKQLVRRALEFLREKGMAYARIETLEQNEIAANFYSKIGFRELARQIHYIMPLE